MNKLTKIQFTTIHRHHQPRQLQATALLRLRRTRNTKEKDLISYHKTAVSVSQRTGEQLATKSTNDAKRKTWRT